MSFAATKSVLFLAAGLLVSTPVTPGLRAMVITDHYSPRNRERAKRTITRYLVLHTTEGAKEGSLNKVHRNGECHYFVDRVGKVYRIIDKARVAYHAGVSMWRGRTNIDEIALGIEVVGTYNGSMTPAQTTALKELVAQLQHIYRIPDDRVLTHCMVAYGKPNRWHRYPHRGRKRCGMLFASDSVRKRLGLESRPTYDPDVRAGRLKVGDAYLAASLYRKPAPAAKPAAASPPPVVLAGHIITPQKSAWDIAGTRYNRSDTVYVFPDGRRINGDKITAWRSIPPGTRIILAEAPQRGSTGFGMVKTIGRDGATARAIAADDYDSSRTIYFLPDGRVRTGAELSAPELAKLPSQTKMLVGYVQGGYISPQRSAFDVCGGKWNHPSTFYRFPDGSMKPGSTMSENAIPKGTQVFFQN